MPSRKKNPDIMFWTTMGIFRKSCWKSNPAPTPATPTAPSRPGISTRVDKSSSGNRYSKMRHTHQHTMSTTDWAASGRSLTNLAKLLSTIPTILTAFCSLDHPPATRILIVLRAIITTSQQVCTTASNAGITPGYTGSQVGIPSSANFKSQCCFMKISTPLMTP